MLFERHHARGLTLTIQGRLFLDHVIRLEAQADRVSNEAKALAVEAAGEIRIGAFWTLAPFFLPTLISGFRNVVPGAIVRPSEMGLAALGAAVRNGEIDLALTYDRGGSLDELEVIELAALQPQVIVSVDHPLAEQDTIELSDLAGLPYVMFDGAGSRAYFEELLAEAALSPEISYASSSLETVRSAVAAGFGFTFLIMSPPNSVTYDGGSVKALRLRTPLRPLNIVLAARADSGQAKISQAFKSHVLTYFS
ncbi:MAG: LysR substrate-binding domain-containing protein [Ruegeria sp.]|nr:LysR substrate-binding domain-containing protein [Ruegeria sp.]